MATEETVLTAIIKIYYRLFSSDVSEKIMS